MKTIFRICMLLLLSGMIAACCNCRHKAAKGERPLVSTTWQLIQIGEQTLKPVAGKYTLQLLEGGQVAAKGDCNQITATYTTDAKRTLRIDAPASTRMMCPDAEGEARYVAMLDQTTHYDMDGAMLLLFEGDRLLAVMQAIEQ